MKILLALLVVSQLATPVSEQVPALNVASGCRAAAAISLADSQNFDECMKDENTARDQLTAKWLSFPAPDRVRCVEAASQPPVASYVELMVCLEMARDAEAAKKIDLKGARKRQ